ncbi:MAG: polysaccharide deacetylase family protein [Clostridia bacterium]|nr:polysaccharide deacetylase family protein [Clostridia bacterium]
MKKKIHLLQTLEHHWQTIALCALCLCLSLAAVAAFEAQTAETFATSDWGLSFGVTGAPPQGNATKEELALYNAYFIGNTEEKIIYLTFDAGYENGYTSDILDTLKKHNVPATFFLVEHYMKTSPDLVKRMAEEGHLIANHTASHPDMSKLDTSQALQAELTAVEEKYKEITGLDMKKVYRPPQGKFSETNLIQAKELGYATVFWSLAYADWDNTNQPDPQKAIQKLNSRIHNGAIVLLHSTSETNRDILERLVVEWKAMGYTFGRLEDLVTQ